MAEDLRGISGFRKVWNTRLFRFELFADAPDFHKG
jgi:hypothetical protein